MIENKTVFDFFVDFIKKACYSSRQVQAVRQLERDL